MLLSKLPSENLTKERDRVLPNLLHNALDYRCGKAELIQLRLNLRNVPKPGAGSKAAKNGQADKLSLDFSQAHSSNVIQSTKMKKKTEPSQEN